jgi:hypothetical protein
MWSFFECGCPQILAAYLEVSNSIGRILLSFHKAHDTAASKSNLAAITDQLFRHDAYQEFLDLMKTYPALTVSRGGSECSVNSALACVAVVRRAVLTAALRDDYLGLQNVISFAAALDTDVALAAVEAVPDAWGFRTSADSLFGLIKSYRAIVEMTQSSEVRAIAIFNLAEVIDQLFGRIDSKSVEGCKDYKCYQNSNFDLNEMIRSEIQGLGALLQNGKKTPSLLNAEIRISGSLLVCDYVFEKSLNRPMDAYKSHMQTWGELLAKAGNASNVSPQPQISLGMLNLKGF